MWCQLGFKDCNIVIVATITVIFVLSSLFSQKGLCRFPDFARKFGSKWKLFATNFQFMRVIYGAFGLGLQGNLHNQGYIYIWNRRVNRSPNKKFLVKVPTKENEKEIIYTFKDADLIANRIANLMIDNFYPDVNKRVRHVVACLLPSGPFLVVNWIGLAKAGLVGGLLNSSVKGITLVNALNAAFSECDTNTKRILIIDRIYLDRLQDEYVRTAIDSIGLEILVFSVPKEKEAKPSEKFCSYNDLLESSNDSSPPKLSGINWNVDPLILIYTSGTTGLPKAVKVTHKRFACSSLILSECAGLNQRDILYCVLPLYHSSGGMLGISSCIKTGSTMIVREKFSASNLAIDIANYKCSIFFYIGELARYALRVKNEEYEERCKSHLRLAFGNGLRGDIATLFQSRYGCKIFEFYGATESPLVLMNFTDKVGPVGYLPFPFKIMYHVYLAEIDENGEIRRDPATGLSIEAKPGQPGHLLAKVQKGREFVGYTDHESTNKKIVRNIIKDGDIFILTGDLLYETDGFYWWCDRMGDTFRWKGENVSTVEVETIVSLANLQGVVDTVVYGVHIPWQDDGAAGMVMMFVETQVFGKDVDSLLQDFRRSLEFQLPNYSIPLFVRICVLTSDTSLTNLEDKSQLLDNSKGKMTETFKHQKKSYREQGFNPSLCGSDLIYYWNQEKMSYCHLTDDRYEKMCKECPLF